MKPQLPNCVTAFLFVCYVAVPAVTAPAAGGPARVQTDQQFLLAELVPDMVATGFSGHDLSAARVRIRCLDRKPARDFAEDTGAEGDPVETKTDAGTLRELYNLSRKIAARDLHGTFCPNDVVTGDEAKKNAKDRDTLCDYFAKPQTRDVAALRDYVYDSLPGWCARKFNAFPPSYYGQYGYVGPAAGKVNTAGTNGGVLLLATPVFREAIFLTFLEMRKRDPNWMPAGPLNVRGQGSWQPSKPVAGKTVIVPAKVPSPPPTNAKSPNTNR